MGRAPRTLLETLVANSRPQPAIPGMFVLLLTLMFAVVFGAGAAAWPGWVMAGGIILSCGLAIAAGFCSVFPPLAWIFVTWLGLGIVAGETGAPQVRIAAFAGMLAAGAMVLLQIWRVRTGRFVPTIGED